MIRFSSEKVKLLHQLMAEATGGSVGVRDEDVIAFGLGTADGSVTPEDVLSWIKGHQRI